jgi:hypothetical protein
MFLVPALILAPLVATADSFGGWDFDPPDGYAITPGPLGVTYTGPGGGFMFLPQSPITGDITATANAAITAALSPDASRQEMLRDSLPGGAERAVWFATDGTLTYIFLTIGQNAQSATALFITPHQDADRIATETDALITATFTPVVLETQTAPAFPALDWPAPPSGITATTRPRMSVAQGLAARLDPETSPLPGTFDCYIQSEPRAVDPRPDLRITTDLGQRYTLTNGVQTATGAWALVPDDVFDQVLHFSGPLESSGPVYVGTNDGLGQSFDIDHPQRNAELTCYQDGPAADTQRQRMAAVAPVKGAMDCIRAEGPPVKLLFGNGIYIADGARGAYAAALDGDYGSWEGRMAFSGGPFDLKDGTLAAEDGILTLTISETWSEGSVFYRSSETTTLALCTMPGPPRPDPVYGLDPAPPATAPHGGLPEGLFRSFESWYVFNGTTGNLVFGDVYTLVAPGGRIITDPDWTAIGAAPDCTRTTPSGEEFCGEYRIIGGMITRRDARDYGPEAWDDNESFRITDTGFSIGEIDYEPVTPPSPDALVGTWTLDGFSGSGPGLGGGVGQYTDSETRWTFTPDGRFDWRNVGTNTTLISPDPILGGVSGGGSSSFHDAGTGTFALDDIWLDLTFDDGRTRRLPVFASPPDADGLRALTIDGTTVYSQ